MILTAAALALALAPALPADDRAPRPSRATAGIARQAATPPPAWTAFATCVERRESKGHAGIVNPDSGAAGLFQFHPEKDWRHGLPYMVADRLVAHGLPRPAARALRITLQGLPIHDWPAIWQRIGFAEVIARGGWRHWALPGSTCNQLVPR